MLFKTKNPYIFDILDFFIHSANKRNWKIINLFNKECIWREVNLKFIVDEKLDRSNWEQVSRITNVLTLDRKNNHLIALNFDSFR